MDEEETKEESQVPGLRSGAGIHGRPAHMCAVQGQEQIS